MPRGRKREESGDAPVTLVSYVLLSWVKLRVQEPAAGASTEGQQQRGQYATVEPKDTSKTLLQWPSFREAWEQLVKRLKDAAARLLGVPQTVQTLDSATDTEDSDSDHDAAPASPAGTSTAPQDAGDRRSKPGERVVPAKPQSAQPTLRQCLTRAAAKQAASGADGSVRLDALVHAASAQATPSPY
jgi:hypothetical protein